MSALPAALTLTLRSGAPLATPLVLPGGGRGSELPPLLFSQWKRVPQALPLGGIQAALQAPLRPAENLASRPRSSFPLALLPSPPTSPTPL